MIRLVVSNQRGGVAKTTTAVNLARCFADRGLKTLLIDTDSQGSIGTILGLKPQFTLHDFLIRQMVLKECVVRQQTTALTCFAATAKQCRRRTS